jgi:hypothetical protein
MTPTSRAAPASQTCHRSGPVHCFEGFRLFVSGIASSCSSKCPDPQGDPVTASEKIDDGEGVEAEEQAKLAKHMRPRQLQGVSAWKSCPTV